MKSKNMNNVFGFLVIALALIFVLPSVSAFATIDQDRVYINSVSYASGETAGVFAGDTIGVRVTFTADEDEEDARVIARILGEPGLSEATERFDVIAGSTYSRLLNIQLPFDIKPNESYKLEVSIESNSNPGDEITVNLEVQRVNYQMEILSVDFQDSVKAGENLGVDVVVKNRGRHVAEDTFVKVSIPELGISKLGFFSDLYEEDNAGDHEDDTASGKVFLLVPRSAAGGVYDLQIEAFNDDSSTTVVRKVVVLGSGAESNVITSSTSKTFAPGEERIYTVTLVNADDRIKIYELITEVPNGLSVTLDESVVAVPAGSSKTVQMRVMSSNTGNYNFAVNVHSENELVKRQNFVANVEGRTAVGGNAAVVLTIILAIIFVVLLIVLIVLLTRKPEKKEDFGESYY